MSTRLKVLVDEFVSMGTNMEDSIRLAKEQIELERKERIKARELQKQEAEFELLKQKQVAEEARLERDRLERIEREKSDLELQKQKQEAEEARLERDRLERIERDKQKQEAEEARLERDRLDRIEREKSELELQKQKQDVEFELLKQKQEADERNRVDQLELQRSKLEHDQNIEKSRLEQQRLAAESDSHLRLHEIDTRSRVVEDRSGASGDGNSFRRYDLGIGLFSNIDKDLDPFLIKFTTVAEAYKLPKRLWAIELAKSLTGDSLLAYETLSGEARLDFDEVVNAVKRRFGVTIRTSRKKFLQAKCTENESQKDYAARLRKYYLEWLDKAEYTRSFDGVLEHIVMDRYYESQSQDLKI